MAFVAESVLAIEETEQVYVLSVVTAADFTVSVPVWLFVCKSTVPDVATKLSPAVKPDHSIVICSVIAIILHNITVSVSRRTSLGITSTTENRSHHL